MSYNSYFPDVDTFTRHMQSSRLIPVCTEIVADLDTPLTLFSKVADGNSHVFLFESMEGGEKWGRFSFIGYNPLVTFSSKDDSVTIKKFKKGAEDISTFSADPIKALKSLIETLGAAEYEELPRFCGGAVGFLGYDMVRFMEELPDSRPATDLPDSSFMVPQIVLVHDSFKQTITVVCWVPADGGEDPGLLYDQAIQEIENVVAKLRVPVRADLFTASSEGAEGQHQFSSNMEKEQFEEMVGKAKEYIRSGDIIQVVLSQRFHTKTTLSPLILYRALRHINPSPYLFFLQLGDLVQIGSSPEILVRKDGQNIELRPIAGTRRRGATPEEDLALEKELLADPKETAEHLMLVDLGRNDVGRVAKGGHVRVQDLLVIEKYSHVMHIVSGVHGEIADGKDQFDVMSACFPAGTVSGAPKIRAMEIIDELEADKRGAYAGSVGYFGFSGNMDFCITIRTFVMRGDDLWVQAGAGIVSDSDPEKEFEETVNKSLGLRRAVELAEKGF
ncbi:MAG: anthranilate synthase component I [Desulfobulbaceae bacterium]|nr:anthranilate synthase component I [Desulfobulbaceae bacterium]